MKINGKTILSTSSTTTNYVLKQSSTAGTLINSQIFDNGTNVGIGTSSPASLLHINNPNTNPNALTVGNNNNGAIYGCATGGNPIIGNYSGDLPIQFGYFSGGISTTFTERMRINSGGNVGIGTTNPEPSSLLDLNSITQGFLAPRMRTSERDSIGSPANGLTIFNTDSETIDVFTNGGGWKSLLF